MNLNSLTLSSLAQAITETRTAAWQSPSNIAIVKYWGKHGQQLPRNPSLSFTLSAAYTETRINYISKNKNPGISFDFLFEGKPNPAFAQRIEKYLQTLLPHLPFLAELQLTIQSRNTFPHSAGIASSASAMSALALCVCSIERQLLAQPCNDTNFFRKASYMARLGSGSAARSVYGKAATWGKIADMPTTSDEFATPFENELHADFQNINNAILIVKTEAKAVSSRAGHTLMQQHWFAQNRYQQARKHVTELIAALKQGDWDKFITITEAEAMSLHAMMLTSEPYVILLQPNTLKIIEKVKAFRHEKQLPVAFTLDAGPNIHLLYHQNYTQEVRHFIQEELLAFCSNNRWLDDKAGNGPMQLI